MVFPFLIESLQLQIYDISHIVKENDVDFFQTPNETLKSNSRVEFRKRKVLMDSPTNGYKNLAVTIMYTTLEKIGSHANRIARFYGRLWLQFSHDFCQFRTQKHNRSGNLKVLESSSHNGGAKKVNQRTEDVQLFFLESGIDISAIESQR